MYLSYKIKSINFKGIPRVINGTQPQPCYIYLDTQNNSNFNYTALPRLQSAKMFNGKRTQTFKFKARGRQDDFGYWFHANNDGPTASIRLRSQAAPDTNIYWQFQITYFIQMRGMVQELQESKIGQGENIVKGVVNKQADLSESQSKEMSIEQKMELDDLNKGWSKHALDFVQNVYKPKVKLPEKSEEQVLQEETDKLLMEIEQGNEFLNNDTGSRKELSKKIVKKTINELKYVIEKQKSSWDYVNEHYKNFMLTKAKKMFDIVEQFNNKELFKYYNLKYFKEKRRRRRYKNK
jgi:hypothetical protein